MKSGIGEPKYYPVADMPSITKVLIDALDNYNEVNAAMNLVLFEDAIQHILRINRILECPRGNALLVGVGKFLTYPIFSFFSCQNLYKCEVSRTWISRTDGQVGQYVHKY